MLKKNKLSNLSTISLLYVEDDLETREELQLILTQYVAKLYTAKNGADGLTLYQEFLPDIVVTDIQMPGMNGLSMAADIRSINHQQPIVILSAYNDVEYLFRALELEIQHYITKPISVERLLNKLSDITEQINIERQLEQNRRLLEQYKSLIDEKAIVVKIDHEGAIIYVNNKFCTLSGYSESELLGQHFLFNVEKNDQNEVLEDLKKTLYEKKQWQGVLKKISKSGAAYVVDVSVIALIDTQNETEEFIALMFDITESYEKYERLSIDLKQDLNHQSHYLHEHERALEIATSLCVIDTEGTIVSANQNFSSALAYTPDELIGLSFYQLIHNFDDFKNRVLTKVKEQGHASGIIKISGKDNCLHTLSTVIVGIHNEQGDIHSLMSICQDISESIKFNDKS